jgi:membrane-associated phospholipid phosphatase
MLFDGVLGLVTLGLWIFCVIDAITTPPDKVRNLPKVVWVLVVILFLLPGAIVWLIAGRPRPASRIGGGTARPATRSRPTNPDDDEEFLASLRARADEQRRRAREAQPHDDDKPGEPTS